MAAKVPPAKLVCRPGAFAGIKLCKWKATGTARVVKFQDRRDPSRFALLHPSSKRGGWWQVTRFDEGGPVGDALRRTADEALSDGLGFAQWYRLARKGEL